MTEKEKLEYELALKIGKKRFGTFCNHSKIVNNKCQKCLRKIIIKK